ncbi:MAG TPA: flagellar hook-associated protein FlgK [Burkholderiaceae bacterium]|nr:flagellar hook-associated protein FlgK [Burkholderiaceae bacterium]
MSGLMSIGKTAMFANYAALQTVGNNIANANTPGYSRQETQLADAPGQFTGSGFFGKGVTVTTIARSYDAYLTSQAVGTSATAAADSARLDKLTQLENVFPLGDSGLGATAGQFLNSFVDLSNTPADSSARQVVLSQAQALASQFAAAGDQLSALQTGVTQDVKTSVASLNAFAQQVAQLNHQIAALQGSGQPPNQLLDQRDQLVRQIAGIVNVTTIPADDGSLGLFIGGGQSLVLGANANTVKAVPDAFDPAKVSLALSEGAVSRLIPPDSLAGGSLSGLLKFQNEDLTAAKNLLGQMATAVSGAVNTQQSLGLDLSQPAGAGAPIFSVGTPRVLPASTNTGSAALSLTVSDTSKVQPSDYAMSFDGTNYVLTRSSDQTAVAGSPFTPAQLAAGVQFDGVTLQLTSGTPASNDRFVLQPVAQAAQTMQMVLGSPQGLAAAAPFTGSMGVSNTGTATLASLVAVNPSYNGALSANIAFTSDTGDYSWTLSDGSAGTGTWTAGSLISLNGFELSLAGVPKSGDTVDVKPTTAVASNNGNAVAFAKLADRGVVAAAGGANGSAGAQTITDAYASAIANVGVRVQSGKTASSISSAVASQAEAARSNKSGVNLDEEAAKLIQFQQSYQAAAKILQVAQQIFDTMLQTAAG